MMSDDAIANMEALETAKAQAKQRDPSMVGDSLQKLDWHIQSLKLRLWGALALRESFTTLPEAAQAEVVNLLQRSMR